MKYPKGIVRVVFTTAMIACFATGVLAQNTQQGQLSQQTDPTRPAFPARAMLLSQDPFASVNFNLCVQASGAGKANQFANKIQNTYNFFSNSSKTKSAKDALSCDSDLSTAFPSSCSMFAATKKHAHSYGKNSSSTDDIETYDPTKQDDIAKQMKDLYNCKSSNIQGAQAAASCFQTQFDLLKSAMTEVSKDFTDSQNTMTTYVNELDAKIETQTAHVTTAETQEKMYQDTRKSVEATLAEVNANAGRGAQGEVHNIAQLRNLYTDFDRMKKDFDQYKASARAGAVGSCIHGPKKTTSVIGKCSADNTYDCVMNFYRDQYINSIGGKSNANNKKGDAAASGFAGDIASMERDLAGAQAFDDSATIIAKYESIFKKYGTAGQLLIVDLKTCDAASKNKIIDNIDAGTGDTGKRKTALDELSVTVNSEASNIIEKLDTATRDAIRTTLGDEPNQLVDGNGCSTKYEKGADGKVVFKDQSLKVQLDCAQGMNENLKAILKGTIPPGSTQPIQFTAGTDDFGAKKYCQGLRDCEKKAGDLKTATKSRKDAMEGNGTFKDPGNPKCANDMCPGRKKFVKEANKNIETTFGQAADMFKTRVATAKSQLDQLKQMYLKAGLTFPSMPDQKASKFTCTGTELCTLPDPFGDSLASAAGLPMLQSKDFDQVIADAKTKKDTLDKQYTDLIAKLPDKAKECKKSMGDEESQRLGSFDSDIQSLLADCNARANGITSANETLDTSALTTMSVSLKAVCKDMQSQVATDRCSKLQRDIQTGITNCSTLATKSLQSVDDRKYNQAVQMQMLKNMNGSTPVGGGSSSSTGN